jgi:hypothetical protein
MRKVLMLLGLAIWPFSTHAAVLFEGYFKIESHGKHIGYVVQRDEVDDKSKQRTLTYLVWKKGDAKVTQEAVQVVATPTSTQNFYAPVSFKHWQGADSLTDVTVGKFGKRLTMVQRDLKTGASVLRGQISIPPASIFSSLATEIFAQRGPKSYVAGQSKSFDALSEEDEKYSDLRLDVVAVRAFDGENIVQVVSRFLSESIELFTFQDGQPLGSRNNAAGIDTFLVSRREEAFGAFEPAASSLELIFKNVPGGRRNPVSSARPKLSAQEVLQSFPSSEPNN